MGTKRQSSEENFARRELEPALRLVSDSANMAKFLSFAQEQAGLDPVKLAARMAHYTNGSRIPPRRSPYYFSNSRRKKTSETSGIGTTPKKNRFYEPKDYQEKTT